MITSRNKRGEQLIYYPQQAKRVQEFFPNFFLPGRK
jgi:hypothetical protein